MCGGGERMCTCMFGWVGGCMRGGGGCAHVYVWVGGWVDTCMCVQKWVNYTMAKVKPLSASPIISTK